MPAVRSSRRCPAEAKPTPYAACSRSHHPAPMPQKARPPVSVSRVATALASGPGDRKVTGLTSVPRCSPVPSPASSPRVTKGSGIGSHGLPTCGIWMRWSISATPANPDSAAARATPVSHPTGSSPHGNRETCSNTDMRPGSRSPPGPGAIAFVPAGSASPVGTPPRAPPGGMRGAIAFVPAGSASPVGAPPRAPPCGDGVAPGAPVTASTRIAAAARDGSPPSTRRTTSQPSASSEAATSRLVRSCTVSTAAGTGRSRAALRARHTAGGVVKSTATPGSPADRASARYACRRSASRPRVSTTVGRRRRTRAATIRSSRPNASAEASRSAGPLPTRARSSSEETISGAR